MFYLKMHLTLAVTYDWDQFNINFFDRQNMINKLKNLEFYN